MPNPAIATYRVTYEWDPQGEVWSADIGGLSDASCFGPSLVAARQSARATVAALEGVSVGDVELEEVIRTPPGATTHAVRPSRSLTRVVVGAGLTSWELLSEQMRFWEAETARTLAAEREDTAGALPPAADEAVDVRDVLLGVVFALEANMVNTAQRMSKRARDVADGGSRMLNAIGEQSALGPIRKVAVSLQEGIETRLADAAKLGRQEEMHSRRLFETALAMVTRSSVDTIVQNPEVREMVRDQSAGLATDAADQVRKQTANADHLVERIARRLLRRSSREELVAAEYDLATPTAAALGAPEADGA